MTAVNCGQHYMLTSVDVAGFSKVFSSMWGGSLYGRFEASAVFMVLLSLCDKDGVVDKTPEAIAGMTGWPLELIERGIKELADVDPRSRTPDEDGRRIVLLDEHRDWGWRITNYKKYREKMRSAERREYLRQAKQRQRERQKSTDVNTSTTVNQNQPIAEAEAEAEAERGRKRAPRSFVVNEKMYEWAKTTLSLDAKTVDFETEKFMDYEYARAKKDWVATWRNWMRRVNGTHRQDTHSEKLARLRQQAGLD